MDYLWLIPLLLVLALILGMFFLRGTKRPAAGRSRLDEAFDSEAEGEDLR